MLTCSDYSYAESCRVMITGGTGSLGKQLTRMILDNTKDAKVVIYSRDEFKQYEMRQLFTPEEQQRLRFFLGDVRDGERLRRAMERVSYVIHAAALKQVPAAEYNPFEFIKTNVIGAENVINAAIENGVKHVVALSTDKAATPINLYGATKLCSDKLFVSGNSYSGTKPTRFSVVRYGNVIGSRGSVVPFFIKKRKDGILPITDPRMTRFWITLDQGASLVLNALRTMQGGEIWVPRIPSMKIVDLATTIAPECELKTVGIRPGEKLHEVMVPLDDGRDTVEFDEYYVICPSGKSNLVDHYEDMGGSRCADRFWYGSDNNDRWVTDDDMVRMIADLDSPEAREWARETGRVS
jgi:UDP-N-acetylglucosamine 4,6-dehydratase/5-epimerase